MKLRFGWSYSVNKPAVMSQYKNPTGSRITVSQARKALGMIGRNYSDEDIVEIVRLMRDIAELSYDDLERTD